MTFNLRVRYSICCFRVCFSPHRDPKRNRSFPLGNRRLLTVGAARSLRSKKRESLFLLGTSCLARKAPIMLGVPLGRKLENNRSNNARHSARTKLKDRTCKGQIWLLCSLWLDLFPLLEIESSDVILARTFQGAKLSQGTQAVKITFRVSYNGFKAALVLR